MGTIFTVHQAGASCTPTNFARYRAIIDPATEVPPAGLLGRDSRRRSTPHIYTEAEIAALLQQPRCLPPRGGLRPATYVVYFALLASTGLRLSEARRLTTDDADLVNGILTIRETKFRKSRRSGSTPNTATGWVSTVACACGRPAQYVSRRPKTFITLMGPMRLERGLLLLPRLPPGKLSARPGPGPARHLAVTGRHPACGHDGGRGQLRQGERVVGGLGRGGGRDPAGRALRRGARPRNRP